VFLAFVIPEATSIPFDPSFIATFTSVLFLTPAPTKIGIFFAALTESIINLGFAVEIEISPPINSFGSIAIKSGFNFKYFLISKIFSTQRVDSNFSSLSIEIFSLISFSSSLCSLWFIRVPLAFRSLTKIAGKNPVFDP